MLFQSQQITLTQMTSNPINTLSNNTNTIYIQTYIYILKIKKNLFELENDIPPLLFFFQRGLESFIKHELQQKPIKKIKI